MRLFLSDRFTSGVNLPLCSLLLLLTGLFLQRFAACSSSDDPLGCCAHLLFSSYFCLEQFFEKVMRSTPVAGNLRRQALISSLQDRYRLANDRADALAKQALFREAVYLGIQPSLFTVPQ